MYIHVETSRHGKVVRYWRHGRGPRIRLPDDPTSAEFAEMVAAAAEHHARTYVAPKRLTISDRQKQSVERAVLSGIARAKTRSAAAGKGFDLDVDWALAQIEHQGMRCALTGIPFFLDHDSRSKVHPYAPSFDRIDAGGSYIKTNVRIITFAMNVMLFDWGIDVFERVSNGYRSRKRIKPETLFPPHTIRCGNRVHKTQ